MAGRGGKRPGAGRKAKKVEELQTGFIAKNLSEDKCKLIIDRMIEIALGDNEKAAVTAGFGLLAYAFGKPTEKHEHSGSDIPIEIVISHVTGTKATD
jgi:hypothetical protein